MVKVVKLLVCFGLIIVAISCAQRNVSVPKESKTINSKDFYPELVNATNDEPTVVRGYIDTKSICWDHDTMPDPDSCETAIFKRCPFAYMPIRIRYCSIMATSNCVIRLPKTEDYHKLDSSKIFRDDEGRNFSPAAEVELGFVAGASPSGGKFVKKITYIKVIPGSFDPVNGSCSATP